MESDYIIYILLFMVLLTMSVCIFFGLCIYFVPVIIAYIRRHKNIFAITILTLFTGWTFFGWLAAVLWSLNSDIKDKDTED